MLVELLAQSKIFGRHERLNFDCCEFAHGRSSRSRCYMFCAVRINVARSIGVPYCLFLVLPAAVDLEVLPVFIFQTRSATRGPIPKLVCGSAQKRRNKAIAPYELQ